MKKLVSISLLFLFLYYTAGYYFVFLYKQQAIRKEIKQKIKSNVPDSELTIIKIINDFDIKSGTKISWIKSNEFRLKDKLFDVVKKAQINDTIIYQCIDDHQESILFADLNKHVSNHIKGQSEEGNNSKNVLNNFFKDFFPATSTISFLPQIKEIEYSDRHFCTLTNSIKKSSPPPRVFFFS